MRLSNDWKAAHNLKPTFPRFPPQIANRTSQICDISDLHLCHNLHLCIDTSNHHFQPPGSLRDSAWIDRWMPVTLGLSGQDANVVNIGIIVSVSILLFQFCFSAVSYQYQLWSKQRSCHGIWLPRYFPPWCWKLQRGEGSFNPNTLSPRIGSTCPFMEFLPYSCSVMTLKMTALCPAY